jgi:hypothetical protein
MPCTVCTHNQLKDIDCALLTGATLISLSNLYGLSKSALHRHKTHLLAKMVQVEKRFRENLRLGILLHLNTCLERSERTAQAAEAEGNYRLVLQADRAAIRILKHIDKMDIQLDQDTVYRLQAAPEWIQQGSLLPTDPQFLAAANQFLADRLVAPCPEPDAAADLEETSTSVPATQDLHSEPETISLDQQLAVLERIFPSLTHTHSPQLRTQDLELRTLFEGWEKSGKLPGNTPPKELNIKYNQLYMSDKKITGKISKSWNTGASPVPEKTACFKSSGAGEPQPPESLRAETDNRQPQTRIQPFATQTSELETFFQRLGDQLKKSGKVIWPRPPLKKRHQDRHQIITFTTRPHDLVPDRAAA